MIRAVEAVGSRSGATTAPVRIAACGQLETPEAAEASAAMFNNINLKTTYHGDDAAVALASAAKFAPRR